MVKILISLFNSLFFLALTLVFFQNRLVAGLVAVSVWHITFFALCLSTMAHSSNNVHFKSGRSQSREDSSQFFSRVGEISDNLPVSVKR